MRTDGSMGGATLSRTRSRVAAAQAVVSVVLLLVVYLTLLRPDSEDQLVAVKARQGSEFSANGSFPASGDERDRASSPDGDAAQGPGADGAQTDPLPLASTLSETAEGFEAPQGDPADPLPPGSSDPPADDSDDSPTTDQYGGAVSRLLGRLDDPD